MQIKNSVEKYIDANALHIKRFWESATETSWDYKTLQDHADYIYTRTLLGDTNWFCPEAAEKYADIIRNQPLAGCKSSGEQLLPHLTAYLLASLNLLALQGADHRAGVLSSLKLDIEMLVDINSKLPKWPAKWSHHTWRVSHWIGGIPSILLTFARHDPSKQVAENLVIDIMTELDSKIIQPSTGLMRAYDSEVLQKIFRLVYRLRHNPEHGDIGGLVHIHWINHVLDRTYIAGDNLVKVCMKHLEAKPFLERYPYCLDFDYVQLLRTLVEQNPSLMNDEVHDRINSLKVDLLKFLGDIPVTGYSMHKIPGALAALHEVCFILKSEVPDLEILPIDIIKTAYWL